MSSWNEASRSVSQFVDKFLDRALGANNDLDQRVPVHDPLHNRFFIGKLSPAGAAAQGDYKMKVAPSSYISKFLVGGSPSHLRMRITPSFSVYFRTAIKQSSTNSTGADPAIHQLYAVEADPALPAESGRDGMWTPWIQRERTPTAQYRQAVQALRVSDGYTGDTFRRHYDPKKAVDAYIRKRYCAEMAFNLALENGYATETKALDIDRFRDSYSTLGTSPTWEGSIHLVVAPEGESTRVTVYLTNSFPGASSPSGDPNWYDVHLKIKLEGGSLVVPVPCPVLKTSQGNPITVWAETKNCAVDENGSSRDQLILSPVARTQTTRVVAYEAPFMFSQAVEDPGGLLETFRAYLDERGVDYRDDIASILDSQEAIRAFGFVSSVYSRTITPDGNWRVHQLGFLVRTAAMYLRRANGIEPLPVVLNVPTAGGKTEAFFAAALFCAFYEMQRRRKSVNIIKYPMKLLTSDQAARLSRYSMIADELAKEAVGQPLGIGYMVGRKGQYESPENIVETCPYPVEPGKSCGAGWASTAIKGGLPTLTCERGHMLHMSVDTERMIDRHCPTFIIAIWDKFISQSAQRRLGLFFGADRYYCPRHGFIDYADTNQKPWRGRAPSTDINCRVYDERNQPCDEPARQVSKIVPGVMVYDEGHLIREADGTLDSHFETAYFHVAKSLSGYHPIPIVSTATIAGVGEFVEQLGLTATGEGRFLLLPERKYRDAFFHSVADTMQHEALAVAPFDVMLTWAVPFLLDAFFETLAIDYGYDATSANDRQDSELNAAGLGHIRQVMVYCSSYKNINALLEMNRNAVGERRQRRGRGILQTSQLSSRYFDRRKAQKAIEDVRNIRQQVVYATNIASIGIDIDNLDVIFFFGLPSNVSEFIQAMNRTGRRQGKPAICLAILGPNKERDMSYYRYWHQFVKGVDYIVEPIPLNRYASSAIYRTFNNIATIDLLMKRAHQQRFENFEAGHIWADIKRGAVPYNEVLDELKEIYRVESDPAQEYGEAVEMLWDTYIDRLNQVSPKDFISSAFPPDWMGSLRTIGKQVRVVHSDATQIIEENGVRPFFSGEDNTDDVADIAPDDETGYGDET